MKLSVIDVGSNSVRLLMWADGRSLYKKIKTTRLGERLANTSVLLKQAMERTADAVADFCSLAKSEGAEIIYIFATAAVRCSKNGSEFVDMVREKCGLDVCVLSGEEEARLGYLGATQGGNGGIIDVGGASTEITVGKDGFIVYAKSVDFGAVRLKDVCGEDRHLLRKYIDERIGAYGDVPHSKFYAIGGTATSICALEFEVEPYDPELIDGRVLTVDAIEAWAERLLSMGQAHRLRLKGMDPSRADILGGGALLLSSVLRYVKAKEVTVSEKDNLEGFIISGRGGVQ